MGVQEVKFFLLNPPSFLFFSILFFAELHDIHGNKMWKGGSDCKSKVGETIPHDFMGLLQVRRLHKFGVTRGELARYLNALLKDSEHLAAMIDNVPSLDNLDFIMESDALGHTVMDQQQGHESLLAVAETVTLEDVMGFFFTTAPVSAVYYYCLIMDILVTYQPSQRVCWKAVSLQG